MESSNSIECEFCKKIFTTKNILSQHQKKAKYCLSLQGISPSNQCEFCDKKLCTNERLLTHYKVCKERQKKDVDTMKKKYEKDIKTLETKIDKQTTEHKQELEKKIKEYEEKLFKQKQEYEEKLEREREVLRQIAMKPTTTNTTKNMTINNTNTLNFEDKDKLNRVIRTNINKKIVEKGQVGIAGVVYNNYLKDENGNQLYVLLDASRQNFQFRDKEGNLVTDVGAKILTDAVAASNLDREAANIAKDIPDLYDNRNKDKFENVLSITGEFQKDNSAFRKEIVHLAKKDQKVKK